MSQRIFESLELASPRCSHFGDRSQQNLSAACEQIVHQNAGVILFLAELDKEPVAETFEAFRFRLDRHRQIEICRPHFGIDLRIECVL